MKTFKTLLIFALSGALIGAVLASLVAPALLGWYNSPGMGKALCDCLETVKDTTARLVKAQLLGTLIGTLSALIVGILVVKASRRHPVPTLPI